MGEHMLFFCSCIYCWLVSLRDEKFCSAKTSYIQICTFRLTRNLKPKSFPNLVSNSRSQWTTVVVFMGKYIFKVFVSFFIKHSLFSCFLCREETSVASYCFAHCECSALNYNENHQTGFRVYSVNLYCR